MQSEKRGALNLQAENIPIEPAPDNAGEGIRETLIIERLITSISSVLKFNH